MKDKGLSPRVELFCQEYVVDRNGTQAAIRTGYSPKTAQVQASRLLSNAKVRARINELLEEKSKRTQITSDTVLRELLRIATVDIGEAFDEAGWLKRLSDIPEDVRRAIAGIEVQEIFQGDGDEKHIIGIARKVKLSDKIRALELLGKYLKLFTDKVEHSGKVSLEQLVAASHEEDEGR